MLNEIKAYAASCCDRSTVGVRERDLATINHMLQVVNQDQGLTKPPIHTVLERVNSSYVERRIFSLYTSENGIK